MALVDVAERDSNLAMKMPRIADAHVGDASERHIKTVSAMSTELTLLDKAQENRWGRVEGPGLGAPAPFAGGVPRRRLRKSSRKSARRSLTPREIFDTSLTLLVLASRRLRTSQGSGQKRGNPTKTRLNGRFEPKKKGPAPKCRALKWSRGPDSN